MRTPIKRWFCLTRPPIHIPPPLAEDRRGGFKTHTGPGKILILGLLVFLLDFGCLCGISSSHTLYVSRVGTESLFSVYLVSSILSLALSTVFCILADRFSHQTFLKVLLPFLGILVFGAWALLRTDPSQPWIYFTFRCLFFALFLSITLSFWLLANDSFGNYESKRYFPYLVGLGFFGDMAGGLLVEWSALRISSVHLILVWSAILFLCPLIVTFLRVGSRPEAVRETKTSSKGPEPFALYFKKGLALLLLSFWVFYSFVAYGTDYVFNLMAFKELPQEDAFMGFLGRVTWISNLGVILYHFTLSPIVVCKKGLLFSVFFLSALIVLSLAWVFFFPSLLSIAVAEGCIYYFVESLAMARLNTVLTLFPQRVRGRLRGFTEGLGGPLGVLLLFLMAAVFSFQLSHGLLTGILFAASLIFLAHPFFFRRCYFPHLIACLKSHEAPLVANAIEALGEPQQGRAVGPLLSLLEQTQDLKLRRKIVSSLGRINGNHLLSGEMLRV